MFFTACKKQTVTNVKLETSSQEYQITQSEDLKLSQINDALKSKYGIDNIDNSYDISSYSVERQEKAISNNFVSTIGKLDLTKSTKILMKNGSYSLLIPSKDLKTKLVVVNVPKTNSSNTLDYSKAIIIDNKIDLKTGTGQLIQTDSDGTLTQNVAKGKIISQNYKAALKKGYTGTYHQKFDRCMDDKYKNICTDMLWCIAWYHPLVIGTAVGVCSVASY